MLRCLCVDKEMASNRAKELQALLSKSNIEYYDKDNPSLSDFEYDKLLRELKEIEQQFPNLVTKNSPTQHVGGTPSGRFAKVTHTVKMESLQDAFNKDEILDFDKRVKDSFPDAEYVVETKIDGLSVSLEYENGVFVRGSTRGDGTIGEDVTENLATIPDIPKSIPNAPAFLEVRGEVYMPRDAFKKLVEYQEQEGKPIAKNPRNAAAGSLRQKNSEITATRGLSIFVFNIQQIQGKDIQTHAQALNYLATLGFKVSPNYILCTNIQDALKQIDKIGLERNDISFDLDGAVIKVNALDERIALGSTNKFPRWAIAFKYPPEQKETLLQAIEVSVGRTGVLTPVALFEPVLLAGTTVSRAILHNQDYINELGVCVGDTILVSKAGDIIPEVIEVVKHNHKHSVFKIPSICPSCGEPTVQLEDEAAVRCINPECPAQLLRNIIHFASRGAMDIDGLGEAVCTQLVEKQLIKTQADIYYLNYDELMTLDKFKEKSSQNLLNAIQQSKNNNLNQLVYGLGIRNVGEKAAEQLAKQFNRMQNIAQASVADIEQIDGFGGIMAQSIVEFFTRHGTQDLLHKLEQTGVNFTYIDTQTNNLLDNQTFVITGTLPNLSRVEAAHLIEQHGGKVTGSISKKTNYLVAGQAAGSKLTKAQNLGIPILDEPALLKLIGV